MSLLPALSLSLCAAILLTDSLLSHSPFAPNRSARSVVTPSAPNALASSPLVPRSAPPIPAQSALLKLTRASGHEHVF